MRFHLTKLLDFLSGMTEGFLFAAIVLVFVVALTEWIVVGRLP